MNGNASHKDDLITTNGRAEREMTPTQATLVVRVVARVSGTKTHTASDADAKLNARLPAVVAALQRAQATVLREERSIGPTMLDVPGREPVVTGYEARASYAVRTKQLGGVAALIDTLIEAGATEVGDVVFGVEPSALEAERILALGEATKNALAKASAIANALFSNPKRGPPEIMLVHITEGSHRYFAAYESSAMRSAPSAMAAVSESVPMSPGTLRIEASVELVTRLKWRD